MPDFNFTLFSDMYSKVSVPFLQGWETIKEDLVDPEPLKVAKTRLPLIILGKMAEGIHRRDVNIQSIEGLALDIERPKGGYLSDPEIYQRRLASCLEALEPFEYVCYSTFSHTDAEPRIRVILPLAAPIVGTTLKADYKRAMSYLNMLTGGIADKAAQKLSQPIFLPVLKPESFAAAHSGKFLDVTSDLASEIIEFRKSLGEGSGAAPLDGEVRAACKKVLEGKPFAEHGERDSMALRIGWHLGRRHPSATLEAVSQVFSWSLGEMTDTKLTVENIFSKIERGSEKIEAEDEQEREAAGPQVTHDGEPLIVQHKSAYYFKAEEGYTRGYIKDELAVAAHRHLRRFKGVDLHFTTSNGAKRRKATSDLVEQYGMLADDVVLDLSAKTSHLQGHKFIERCLEWPTQLEPEFNPDIDRWLRHLAGKRSEEFMDWLSMFHDLDRLLTALVIMGEPNTGKTLLAMGLASRFGCDSPASQKTLTGQFQGELVRCPLVYIDEEITDNSYQRSFLATVRAEISVRERNINRKHMPAIAMRGAIRCIITANHLPFKAKDAQTRQDLNAIAERFHWIHAHQEAADFLATIEAKEKQRWRKEGIARHVMHLEQTREVDYSHRFGVTGDAERLADLINISVEWNGWVTEWVCNGVLNGFSKLQSDSETATGAAIVDGKIYVRVQAVVKAWNVYLPDIGVPPNTRPISDALKGIAHKKVKPKDVGIEANNQYRYYEIRLSPLLAFLEEVSTHSQEEFESALEIGSTFKSAKVIKLSEGKTA